MKYVNSVKEIFLILLLYIYCFSIIDYVPILSIVIIAYCAFISIYKNKFNLNNSFIFFIFFIITCIHALYNGSESDKLIVDIYRWIVIFFGILFISGTFSLVLPIFFKYFFYLSSIFCIIQQIKSKETSLLH